MEFHYCYQMDNIVSAHHAHTLRVMRGVLALCTHRSQPRIRGFQSVSSQTLKAHALGNSGARLANSMPVDTQRASPRIRMRGQREGRRALRRMEPAHFSSRCGVGLLHRRAKRLQVLARLICFPHIAGPHPVHSTRTNALARGMSFCWLPR